MKRTRSAYNDGRVASRGLDHAQLVDHASDQTTRQPHAPHALLQHLLLHAHRVCSRLQPQLLREAGRAGGERVAVAERGAFGIDVENGVVVDVVEDSEDAGDGVGERGV